MFPWKIRKSDYHGLKFPSEARVEASQVSSQVPEFPSYQASFQGLHVPKISKQVELSGSKTGS